jgi:hypothetical protein
MPSHDDPRRPGEGVSAKALDAVRLGASLDADHRADPGALRSIGTCRICGILSYEASGGPWKHVPAVDECGKVDNWVRQHQQMAASGGGFEGRHR